MSNQRYTPDAGSDRAGPTVSTDDDTLQYGCPHCDAVYDTELLARVHVTLVRTEKGDIVVRPIHSVTDLRGILEGKTDEQGRSATDRLHEERAADKASEEELRQRYAGTDEADI